MCNRVKAAVWVTHLSWMFFRTIRKYDLMSLSMTSQSLCSRDVNFLDTGTGWQWRKYRDYNGTSTTSVCKFTGPTTSSRLTAWPFIGLEGKGGCAAALSSPFFNIPLQFPVPASVWSPAGPPAAAYGGDRASERRSGVNAQTRTKEIHMHYVI